MARRIGVAIGLKSIAAHILLKRTMAGNLSDECFWFKQVIPGTAPNAAFIQKIFHAAWNKITAPGVSSPVSKKAAEREERPT
ncbi:hypothetical protein [Rhizobium mongolense]|uniref:Transposase IS66 family protein n=2 Tax=Rhizobium mongolense TaxID=57676 RepID=A0ABR6IM52_9HYPH|nr:hypothetical protein [Rhizobium mongolense]MBB4228973.1 hypothetical protein [Rhizobium mongolense]TVZ63467.1 hypothetical protein BCL32_3612 [Rhizobium mongolense USDA 1844]